MKELVKKEVEKLCKKLRLDLSVEEFKSYYDWYTISAQKTLSEDFIREFQNKVYWFNVSRNANLSESFIYEFKDKLNIYVISERNIITQKRIEELEYEDTVKSRFELLDI